MSNSSCEALSELLMSPRNQLLKMKIFAEITVSGRKQALDVLNTNNAIRHGEIKQLWLKRKQVPQDLWVYNSPLYIFNPDSLDEELYSFLHVNRNLSHYLHNKNEDIDDAYLSIITTDQTFEEMFACLFSLKTITLLGEIGLGLEIDPEVVMPDFPYWVSCETD